MIGIIIYVVYLYIYSFWYAQCICQIWDKLPDTKLNEEYWFIVILINL